MILWHHQNAFASTGKSLEEEEAKLNSPPSR